MTKFYCPCGNFGEHFPRPYFRSTEWVGHQCDEYGTGLCRLNQLVQHNKHSCIKVSPGTNTPQLYFMNQTTYIHELVFYKNSLTKIYSRKCLTNSDTRAIE